MGERTTGSRYGNLLSSRKYEWLTWCVFLTSLWGILLLAFYWLFNFRQDLIVTGTYVTIATTLVAFVTAWFDRVKRFAKKHFSRVLIAIDENHRLLVSLLLVSVPVALITTVNMFSEYRDRYTYVRLIQSAVKSDVFESLNVPDPALLAQSFLLAPSRPESALLLIRASRIFFLADDADRFRQYQRDFIGDVVKAIDAEELDLCHESSELYDPAVFVALVNAETAYTSDADSSLRHRVPTIEQQNRAIDWSISLLERCEDESIDRSLYILKLKHAASGNSPAPAAVRDFNLEDSLKAFASKVNAGLGSADAVNFYRRHAYQEYVDFLAHLGMEQLLAVFDGESGCTNAGHANFDFEPAEKMDEVINQYRKILMLRLRLARTGDVIWHTTPSKLTLYHWFADKFGFSSHVTRYTTASLKNLPDCAYKNMIVGKLNSLLDAPAFSAFKVPREWAKSSPLDYELEGQSLVAKLDEWLLENW